jgi:hypothetical protein
MVIDSSAIIAILCDEPEAERFTKAIENDPTRLISAASLLETSIVIENRYVVTVFLMLYQRFQENHYCSKAMILVKQTPICASFHPTNPTKQINPAYPLIRFNPVQTSLSNHFNLTMSHFNHHAIFRTRFALYS